jgi:hypothetical protein
MKVIRVQVTPTEAWKLIRAIPHNSCQSSAQQCWVGGGDAGVTAQSICWLYCWAKTGMNSNDAAEVAKQAFDQIFDQSYEWFDARVSHEWARKARYKHGDIESQLAARLSDVDDTNSLREAGLESAIALAVKTHLEQTDKAGEPYILHPLRVMFRLSSGNERIVGVLHDVVEDSEVSFNDLRKLGFSDIVIDALKAVTKLPAEKGSDEGYQAFVKRAGANPIARQVKIADLMDNLDVTRLKEVGGKDSRRISKYLRALRYLESLD